MTNNLQTTNLNQYTQMKPISQNCELAPNTVLIVDDDEFSREMLAELVSDENSVIFADNGEQGLEIYDKNKNNISAILLDLNMPVMDGWTLLRKMGEKYDKIPVPVFILTDEKDSKNIHKACELGAVEVISKVTGDYFMEKRRIQYMIELFNSRNNFEKAVEKKTAELRVQNMGIIMALATATEFRSGESGEHVRRLYSITKLFLEETYFGEKYSREKIEQIATAAILHDVGKIAVRDKVLKKQGKLDKDEFEEMKLHTVEGEKMLRQIPQLKNLPFYKYARVIALFHHERWDGKGYPYGLKGKRIPLAAQIVSIADVYDALVNERVYKPKFTHEEAVEMIVSGKCGVFNPDMLKEFTRIADKINRLYTSHEEIAHTGDKNGCQSKSSVN